MRESFFFETSADVVVVGGGLAGLAAVRETTGLDVVVVHPDGDRGSSRLARGGLAVARGEADVDAHVEDTCVAGAGLCHRRRVELLVRGGRDRVAALLREGMPFDRDENGRLDFGLEAGHSKPRILHAGGDATGEALVRFMVERVRGRQRMRRMAGRARDLVLDRDGRIAGVNVVNDRGVCGFIRAPDVVLATGGIGALFSRTSNGRTSLGDGLAIAARAGAWLVDLEFVQFHPTALDVSSRPLPLITEALRGAGARLVSEAGELIMAGVHPDRDLAPRDVVAREVAFRGAEEQIFLDASRVDDLEGRFPSVVEACRDAGVDPTMIPVAPAAHYHMGGIDVDDDGRTSVEGLWACGEVAGTGVHGANRLASNSLLEALVFGSRVGRTLANGTRGYRSSHDEPESFQRGSGGESSLGRTLRQLCWDALGLERNAMKLWRAAEWLDVMSILLPPSSLFARRVLVARLLVEAAFRRRESRGGHFRIDHPEREKEFERRMGLRWSADRLALSRLEVSSTHPAARP